MQTLKLVTTVRNLTTEMKEERLESGISGRPISPDLKREFQKRLDLVANQVRNPTLSCLIDLLDVSTDIGLDTSSLRDVVREGQSCYAF